MGVLGQLKHAWNAFNDRQRENNPLGFGAGMLTSDASAGYGGRPDRVRLSISNERSIISAIYNRLSVDVAALDLRHVRLDEDNRYLEDIKSGLNECLTLEANLDQSGRALLQDMVMSLCDQGTIAIVPVDTTLDPRQTGGYDIKSIRVGSIVEWQPKRVKVNLYNEETGRRENVTLDKRLVAIVQNPLYAVMNEPNSTLQRLISKLNMLDAIDSKTSSGKLDMIIQLPYVIKSDARRQQADQRRKDIEWQLTGSPHGIAYTDGTEKIVQLNRPVENNLLKQVEYLVTMLYGQLGLTEEIMNGTADEAAMLNYRNRTLEPIIGAIALEMKRKFLTRTARTQGQSIEFFIDPFKLVPMKDIAEMADKLTRNEIATGNEIRGVIGMRPSKDPKADELRNSNMPVEDTDPGLAATPAPEEDTADVEDAFAGINGALDKVFEDLGVAE